MVPSSFLKQLGMVITGDGQRFDRSVELRGAYLLSDGSALTTTLTTNPGFAAVETNGVAVQWAATKVVGAAFAWNVPGDYDQTNDELRLRFVAQGGGATDTPGLTLNVYRKRAGAALSADLGPVTAKTLNATTDTPTATSFAASATAAGGVFDLSGLGLKPGDVLYFKIVPGAHGTDALNLLQLVARYKGDVVLFDPAKR